MWFDTPYGFAYAPDTSGLRDAYRARGYREVPDSAVVGLADSRPDEHDDQADADAVRQAITDEVPEHERGTSAEHDEKG